MEQEESRRPIFPSLIAAIIIMRVQHDETKQANESKERKSDTEIHTEHERV